MELQVAEGTAHGRLVACFKNGPDLGNLASLIPPPPSSPALDFPIFLQALHLDMYFPRNEGWKLRVYIPEEDMYMGAKDVGVEKLKFNCALRMNSDGLFIDITDLEFLTQVYQMRFKGKGSTVRAPPCAPPLLLPPWCAALPGSQRCCVTRSFSLAGKGAQEDYEP